MRAVGLQLHLLYVSLALATPLTPRLEVNTQSCHVSTDFTVLWYKTEIGIPFDQARCDNAHDGILDTLGFDWWDCRQYHGREYKGERDEVGRVLMCEG